LAEGDAAEQIRLLDAICTHETRFFREESHFSFLAREVFPRWRAEAEQGKRKRRVRVWSAACSSGEEPFSLAMLLRDHLPEEEGWDAEVLATDLSTRVLERAQTALWPISRAEQIPSKYLKEYMLKGTGPQEGMMRATPELRRMVRFRRVNLHDERYPVEGRFDLVFCRNVLIYFDNTSRTGVVRRLMGYLETDGMFFLGHSESLSGVDVAARTLIPTVYCLPESSAAVHAARDR
jgi:chemotaxis protein methyltransferase CheR